MSLSAAAIRVLAEKGLSASDIADVAEAHERRADPTAAERQRRCRENKKANGHGVTVTRDKGSNDKDILTSKVSPISTSSEVEAPTPLTKREVIDAWQARMVPLGFPPIRKMTSQRERQLAARLKDSTLEDWQRAMDALERSTFCRGENDRGWRADFDFLLQPKSFTKLLEGAYDH